MPTHGFLRVSAPSLTHFSVAQNELVLCATADYTDEMMHAALDINLPNYANAIVTTTEIVDAISR